MNENKEPQIEIYTLEWCPYCRRAKAYFKSQGFSFKEYDIGKSEKHKKKMIERSGGEKTVPQIFINNKKIGGYDDLLEKKNSGQLIQLLGLTESKNFEKSWDLVIVGAGAAGLNAALYAARKGLKVLILSSAMGGQMVDTGEIGNYLGLNEVKGPDLIQLFWEHVQDYNVNLELGEIVVDVKKRDSKDIIVKTKRGQKVQTKTVIIATGTKNRQLNVPGEEELKGKGVHYCATCDGFMYENQPVAVVGGGNAGLEASLDLVQLGCDVDLFEIRDDLAGDKVLQNKVKNSDNIKIHTNSTVEEINGEENVDSIIVNNVKTDKKKTFELEAIFIEIGLIPNSEFIKDKVQINEINEIVINENNETSLKGIWAAGDVTDIKDKQIVIAAGEGAKTALRINEYLN